MNLIRLMDIIRIRLGQNLGFMLDIKHLLSIQTRAQPAMARTLPSAEHSKNSKEILNYSSRYCLLKADSLGRPTFQSTHHQLITQ